MNQMASCILVHHMMTIISINTAIVIIADGSKYYTSHKIAVWIHCLSLTQRNSKSRGVSHTSSIIKRLFSRDFSVATLLQWQHVQVYSNPLQNRAHLLDVPRPFVNVLA